MRWHENEGLKLPICNPEHDTLDSLEVIAFVSLIVLIYAQWSKCCWWPGFSFVSLPKDSAYCQDKREKLSHRHWHLHLDQKRPKTNPIQPTGQEMTFIHSGILALADLFTLLSRHWRQKRLISLHTKERMLGPRCQRISGKRCQSPERELLTYVVASESARGPFNRLFQMPSWL